MPKKDKETGITEALQRIEQAERSQATVLDLSWLGLAAIPDSIAQLANLTELNLGNNQIAVIPDSIAQLANLTALHLDTNQIAAIPDSIAQLANLTTLYLYNNQIAVIPDSIAHLANLANLDLSYNQIAAIPNSIAQLANLTNLYLGSNQLAAIPNSIAQLANLTHLNLGNNQIAAIPDSIAQLANLRALDLSNNQITAIPDSIAQLANLTHLYLYNNQIAAIPDSIAELTNLTALDLDTNQIAAIPDSIAELTNLIELYLSNNQIAAIHHSIAQLPALRELKLEGNPLDPELAAAYAEGLEALKRYLLSKKESQVVLREAKLILVGEGEVGKTCLLYALRDDEWVEKRDSTHGIEIKPLKLSDPSTCDEITLNGWDFGGQRVYRPTHQLFFSSPAVYLVVWKPREGPQQGFVKEWIRLVKHREPAAKILVVATHGGPGGRQPDIDRQEIWDLFGRDTVVDFFHVESKPPEFDEKSQKWTGDCKGLGELKDAIAKLACSLPEVGRPVPKRWQDVRHALKQSGEAYLSLNRLLTICSQHEMSDEEAGLFIRMSHRLGRLIHYEHDPRLRDIVILKPDWLATAVSFVLDDEETRRQHGLVKFSRLSKLWSDKSRDAEFRYPQKVHPMFVALMERFDLSYQVAGSPLGGQSDETSLIAQLVPDVRPEADIAREWSEEPQNGDEQQIQTCRIVDAKGQSTTAEGLFYQLIVRLHKFSLGREDFDASVHWQRGLILDDEYNGRAFLEQVGNDVRITVRAAYPGNLLAVLTSEVKWLVENFWEGLKCEVVVPCLEPCGKKLPGTGVFEVQKLIAFKRQGMTLFPCTVSGCDKLQDIQRLLQNAPPSRAATVELPLTRVDEMLVRLEEIRQQNIGLDRGMSHLDQDVRQSMSQVEAGFRGLMQTIVDEAKDAPRLFSFEPAEHSKFDPVGWVRKKFRITLWCEHTRLPLPLLNGNSKKGVYEFDVTREWFIAAAPFLKLLTGTLSLMLPVAASATKLALDEVTYKGLERQLDFGKECAKAMLDAAGDAGEWLAEKDKLDPERTGMIRAQGGVLREFQAWLKQEDPSFGDLRKVLNKRQEFLWVHRDFEKEY